jgi:ferric-dicitrate binding protein FerR (iron transport regulator)
MENNSQYDELLIKYLVNEVNAEEKVFVENWIDANEANRRYFDSLRNAWQLSATKKTLDYILDEMNVDEKWNHFKQNVTAKETRVIPLHTQEQFEGRYFEDESPVRKPLVYRILMAAAVAASVILVVGLGWKLFVNNDNPETPVARHTEKKTDSLTFVVRHEINTTGKEKRINLPDGSLIVLANNSEVTYREPFTGARDIILKGKAYFRVAKDKSRPFTVVSGDVSTTALGTEFTITAYERTKRIIVRLYEGKVVVKAVNEANKWMKADVYLLPGQEFVYGRQTTGELRSFKMKNAPPEHVLDRERLRDNPSIPGNSEGSWYMFNNESLAQVLDELAALYNVRIVYHKKDIRNIYFTGKYNKSDSLETILKRISTLNDLTVTKNDTAFILTR